MSTEKKNTFHYGEDFMTIKIALDVADGKMKGELSNSTIQRVSANEQVVKNIVSKNKVVYGITTGFGPLCTSLISEDETAQLQHNLLMSHSVGVGNPISPRIAKLMMILKVHALCKGYSGVSLKTIQRIIWHIENDVIPCVPEQGSVGASGDLAPLSHLFLPLIGLGEVWQDGEPTATQEVLKKHKLEPHQLGPKEGLGLINGTQFMAAHGLVLLEKLQNCLDHADMIAALNLEAMMGSASPFDKDLHSLRPHSGAGYVAMRMRTLLEDSEILKSHANCDRVQDPYSLRCIPQVHGASRNAWLHLKETLLVEINSVTDNPVVFSEEKTISGGHFHGQPIALPLDYAGLAAAEIGNISDRRTYLSLTEIEPGIPKLLMKSTGLNSGFMILQYTSAALVSENKSLCFPASADSVPTSLGQEDHVSMGSISARKSLKIVENLEKILGVEMMCAAQGFDFRKPMKSSVLLDEMHNMIREHIDFADEDRVFYTDIDKAIKLIQSKEIIKRFKELSKTHQIDLKNEEDELFGL